jgi:two-component system, chemotaxis family, protein-glutamate methylesterase/glutaminase
MRVLVVDDSIVFRSQISKALSQVSGLEVVGSAANGKIALQKLEQSSIDLITLDMEMPEMNGLDFLREIRNRGFSVRVIVFSSQTQKGAELAIKALETGADDVIPKPQGEGLSFENAAATIQEMLVPKILQFTGTHLLSKDAISQTLPKERPELPTDLSSFSPSVLVIGCSTGGPTALETIFGSLTAPIPIPILITQHMPPLFTAVLARRLSELSGIPSKEAQSGDLLRPNQIYVAPGDFHLLIDGNEGEAYTVLNQKPQRNSVRPAVDYLFESTAKIYKSRCLGLILTGMGQDGLVGSQEIRKQGGAIIIQDRESSVVFGMPGAIYESGEYDMMLNLNMIPMNLAALIKKNRRVNTMAEI